MKHIEHLLLTTKIINHGNKKCRMGSGEKTIFSKNYSATVVNINAVNVDFGKND